MLGEVQVDRFIHFACYYVSFYFFISFFSWKKYEKLVDQLCEDDEVGQSWEPKPLSGGDWANSRQ